MKFLMYFLYVYICVCNISSAYRCRISEGAMCTSVIYFCGHLGAYMDLPPTSALTRNSAGDSSLPLGVGSSSSPQWGSKRITAIYVF